MNDELSYYSKNGLSPLRAFRMGLLSRDEYMGFLKGNVIKYVVRCEDKGNPLGDIEKAMVYLSKMKRLLNNEL